MCEAFNHFGVWQFLLTLFILIAGEWLWLRVNHRSIHDALMRCILWKTHFVDAGTQTIEDEPENEHGNDDDDGVGSTISQCEDPDAFIERNYPRFPRLEDCLRVQGPGADDDDDDDDGVVYVTTTFGFGVQRATTFRAFPEGMGHLARPGENYYEIHGDTLMPFTAPLSAPEHAEPLETSSDVDMADVDMADVDERARLRSHRSPANPNDHDLEERLMSAQRRAARLPGDSPTTSSDEFAMLANM